jgi:glycosyltransferase involved in cell wall biosynthesis
MPGRIRRRLAPLIDDLFNTPVAAIEAVIREEKCDAIFMQDYESTRFDQCIRIGRRIGVPVFATFTGTNPQPAWQKPFRRTTMQHAAGFVICAQSEIDRVRAAYDIPDARLLKLYYPLDPAIWYPEDRGAARQALGLDPAATIAVFHGMIHIRVKGLDILLDAWERVVGPAPDPRYRLVLLGDGPDAGRLAETIRSKGRDDVIFVNEWLHDRPLIRRYLSAADLYVFPTRVDAFGISVTEGMACGLPVVAARGRGTLDIFPEGERSGGVVVPSGDVEAFAEGLRRMLHNPSLRERLGASALRRVKDPDLGPAVGAALAEFFFPQESR